MQFNMKNHILPLVDCRTLAVTNILNEDNITLDNEMLFALCGALDIWACKTSEYSKTFIIITRNMSAEMNFLKRLGYSVIIEDFLSNDDLVQYLKNDNRVILDVDRYFLPNYTEKFGSQHFGFHCFNLLGFNDENERVFFAYEFLREKKYQYTDNILKQARFAKCDMYSPKARAYIILKTSKFPPINNSFFYKNLLITCENQLFNKDGLIYNYDSFINDIKRIELFINNPMLNRFANSQLGLIKRSLLKSDYLGTGYRVQHSNGLMKISDFCKDKTLEQISLEWKVLTQQWVDVYHCSFSEISHKDQLNYWITFFADMKNKEQTLYKKLKSHCEAQLSMMTG